MRAPAGASYLCFATTHEACVAAAAAAEAAAAHFRPRLAYTREAEAEIRRSETRDECGSLAAPSVIVALA